jgi:hypothetical protein
MKKMTIYLAPDHGIDCPSRHEERLWCEDNVFENCETCGAKPEKYIFLGHVDGEGEL